MNKVTGYIMQEVTLVTKEGQKPRSNFGLSVPTGKKDNEGKSINVLYNITAFANDAFVAAKLKKGDRVSVQGIIQPLMRKKDGTISEYVPMVVVSDRGTLNGITLSIVPDQWYTNNGITNNTSNKSTGMSSITNSNETDFDETFENYNLDNVTVEDDDMPF